MMAIFIIHVINKLNLIELPFVTNPLHMRIIIFVIINDPFSNRNAILTKKESYKKSQHFRIGKKVFFVYCSFTGLLPVSYLLNSWLALQEADRFSFRGFYFAVKSPPFFYPLHFVC